MPKQTPQKDQNPGATAGWSSTWSEFLNSNQSNFVTQLEDFHNSLPWTKELSPSQRSAWQKEHSIIQLTLHGVINNSQTDPSQCWITFEQELPGEAGKRAADVNLILPTGHLYVIEFKDKTQASEQEIIRAQSDLDTLHKFHSESTSLTPHGFLILTATGAQPFHHPTLQCDQPNAHGITPRLQASLQTALQGEHIYNTHQWQQGRFHRQPSILAGTVEIFFKEHIPELQTEAGENIREARELIQTIYQHAKAKKDRYVVLVGGAPGAGKTLLGLSAVAETISNHGIDQCSPIYISGNNPLVGVLQYTLNFYGAKSSRVLPYDARTVILPVIEFKKQYSRRQAHYDLVVFDEAQRSWDHAKFFDGTEIDLLCDWLTQKEYGIVVLLIGDGQAIYRGEMPLDTMMQSLAKSLKQHENRISLIAPSNYQHYLQNIPSARIEDNLYLNSAIRQPFAEAFEQWLEAVMEGNADKARSLMQGLKGYPMKLTRSREEAEQYARGLHQEHHEAIAGAADQFRYGWLISSKSGDKSIFQPHGGKAPGDVFGPWFVNPPEDPKSCCQLKSAATEFACQGLEISLAMVKWGQDLLWRSNQWKLSDKPYLRREHDEFTIATYRVLLSRGRVGLVICCDDIETYNFFSSCGMK